jgi:hypothetical protein
MQHVPLIDLAHTWSLTLREEHRLRMFENRALRNILWLKKEKVRRDWIKLRDMDFCALYLSTNSMPSTKSRRVGGAEHVARMRELEKERRNAYRALIVKPERKWPLETRTNIWKGNIKVDFREVGWKMWTALIWYRTGGTCGFLRAR